MAARLLAVLIVLLAVSDATAQEELVIVGRVDRLVDGDTIDVLLEGDDETTRIRMQGIDAPETDQPMSDDAVALLGRLLGDGEVELQPAGQTSYDRMVARVFANGIDVNAAMVGNGLAMAERRFLGEFDDGESYCMYEHAARSDKRGIWRLTANQRVAPWEWRQRARSGYTIFTDYGNETVDGCVAAIGKPLGATRPGVRPSLPDEPPSEQWRCAVRKTCGQIQSCEEERYLLKVCGMAGLDGNDDGEPCESRCR